MAISGARVDGGLRRHFTDGVTHPYDGITWERRDAAGVLLRWTEKGLNGVTAPTRKGFGSRLIAHSLQAQLGGQNDFAWLRARIERSRSRGDTAAENDG